MNIAGLIVVGAGLFLIVVALRNTQSNVFPFFFSNPNSTTGTTTNGNPIYSPGGTGIFGQGCPSGYHAVTVLGVQWCFSDLLPSSANTNAVIPMPTGTGTNTNGTGTGGIGSII